MRTQTLFVVLTLGGSLFFGPSLHGAPVEAQYGTHDRPLEGWRYETLRALALREYPQRGEQFLGELNYFAAQSRALDDRANAARVDPQQIGPVVDLLLEEARQADRRMRDARVFLSVWDDSGRTITLLQRMASLVSS